MPCYENIGLDDDNLSIEGFEVIELRVYVSNQAVTYSDVSGESSSICHGWSAPAVRE